MSPNSSYVATQLEEDSPGSMNLKNHNTKEQEEITHRFKFSGFVDVLDRLKFYLMLMGYDHRFLYIVLFDLWECCEFQES